MWCLAVLALLAALLLEVDASTDSTWPRSAQPFFLSATRGRVTAAEARYLGRLPVVVINHKQGPRTPGTRAEARQLYALSQVRRSSITHGILTSAPNRLTGHTTFCR